MHPLPLSRIAGCCAVILFAVVLAQPAAAWPPANRGVEAQTLKVAEVTAAMAGQPVKLTGRVAAINEPRPGSKAPYNAVLEDGGSKVTVVYWAAVAENLTVKPTVGALVEVEGTVDVYKDQIQIKVNNSSRFRVLEGGGAAAAPAGVMPTTPAAKPLKINAVTAAMARQTCTVTGKLGQPENIKGGVKFPLTDETGSILLVLWDRQVPPADRASLAAGATITVAGRIEDYKGQLEIVPKNAGAITVTAPAPLP